MTPADSLQSDDTLRSLRLLRSTDPADRQRGIEGLAHVADDPRVIQVFEYLYEKDPDPGVREAVWRVLNRQGPSVPAPTPAERAPAARGRARSSAPRSVFLLNPAHRSLVRRYLTEGPAPSPRGSRLIGAIVGALLLIAGFLAGLAAPAWYDWYRLREDGARADAAITGLIAPLDPAAEAPYAAAYRFRIPGAPNNDAPSFFGEQRVSAGLHRWLAEARPQTLPVIYLPDDPSVSRLDIASPDDTRRERLAVLAAGAVTVALLVSVIGWIARLPSKDALRGRLVRGQVVAAQTVAGKSNGQRLAVRFRFRSPTGRVITSEATRARGDLRSGVVPPPGTPVMIEYHSDRRFRLL
ncbi:MAG: hypothetical protein LC121_09720 [Anaerolineae bacterium]|nr:hypothetical protein [Anaerolineae bacterium]